MAWSKLAVGLVMDPWRFDPAAAVAAANRVIRARSGSLVLLRTWASEAATIEESMAAVIAARIALSPVPVYGLGDTFTSDAPRLPHHPFIMSGDVPFLPASAFEGGGTMPGAADVIEACFAGGVLSPTPLEPADPIRAVVALIASETWDSLILSDAKPRASRMVRWQAVRATGRTDLLKALNPSTTDDDNFEKWWQSSAQEVGPE